MAHRPDAPRDPGAAPAERDRGAVPHERDRDAVPPEQRQGGTGLATAAVVIGVIALLLVVLTFGGLFFLALPLGIAAMVMGSMARRRADRGEADPRGRGRARAGFITGLIATILSVLVVLLIALGVALLSSLNLEGLPDQIQDQIPQQLQEEAQNQLQGD